MSDAPADRPAAPAKRGLRRRIASLVFLVAVIVVGGKLLGARDKLVPFDVDYRLGDPPVAQRISVDMMNGDGDSVGHFDTTLVAPVVHRHAKLPPGDYTFDITLTSDGVEREVTRDVEVKRDAHVTIDLSNERPRSR